MDKEAQQYAELMNLSANPGNTTVSDYATLESINDDCLRYIVKYLNVIDVVNLSATCPRLLQFAETAVFPKKANTICIELDDMALTAKISAPSDRTYPSQFILYGVETPLRSFGGFVKDLKFIFISNDTHTTSFWESVMIIH